MCLCMHEKLYTKLLMIISRKKGFFGGLRGWLLLIFLLILHFLIYKEYVLLSFFQ